MKNEYLYDWFFHFNPYCELWCAVPTTILHIYLNDYNNPNIIRAKKLSDLLELLHKYKGQSEEIKKIEVDNG